MKIRRGASKEKRRMRGRAQMGRSASGRGGRPCHRRPICLPYEWPRLQQSSLCTPAGVSFPWHTWGKLGGVPDGISSCIGPRCNAPPPPRPSHLLCSLLSSLLISLERQDKSHLLKCALPSLTAWGKEGREHTSSHCPVQAGVRPVFYFPLVL